MLSYRPILPHTSFSYKWFAFACILLKKNRHVCCVCFQTPKYKKIWIIFYSWLWIPDLKKVVFIYSALIYVLHTLKRNFGVFVRFLKLQCQYNTNNSQINARFITIHCRNETCIPYAFNSPSIRLNAIMWSRRKYILIHMSASANQMQ